MAQLSRLIGPSAVYFRYSSGISKGVFGAIALSLTFGAVASGRDLAQRDASGQMNSTQINSTQINSTQINSAEGSAVINRTAKADRAARVAEPASQTQTVSLRLNGVDDTSVLVRIPADRMARGGTPASLLIKSGSGRTTLACEPVVSVLTEVARQLQPGSCVT